ncbi:sigma-70 family RNA polymerase sigma factor [Fictibacillus sp. b24]|uniref:sigma-70 family RNA polymerase sigma factor n=1 Tax=Fictibacillus sp. b24 TaxID=3055863 RepID=UPI0025A09292|nr:sigma-70 family RNA polymerase sigma factor [Fictibacillus sp. b24]MDM5317108.1 sigma-70 family RNA polymerase sigma factor [Fictibacillus sp. b24]
MQLEDVYKLYMNDLYRYLYSLSKDHYVAEDLMQEAFYKAYLTLADYEISNIKAWLFKVAYHAFIDYQRKNKRTILADEIRQSIEANSDTPEKKIVEKESFSLLLEDLNQLKEIEKQAVLLCDLHELSYQEAADVLELKVNTFKSHILRGRKKLMERVKERMYRDD